MSTGQPLEAYGIRFSPPSGWSAAISRFADEASPGSTAMPIVNVCSLPLPEERGAFGSGVVEHLGPTDVFVALVEYVMDPEATMFDGRLKIPTRLSKVNFRAGILQRTIQGQGGCQLFFKTAGRAFSLYVVLGSLERIDILLPPINEMLDTLAISAEDASIPATRN